MLVMLIRVKMILIQLFEIQNWSLVLEYLLVTKYVQLAWLQGFLGHCSLL